jgi:uncharacterized membrane protein YhaH (DUF805 family)
MIEAYLKMWKNIFNYSGRISRKEFFLSIVVYYLVWIILCVVLRNNIIVKVFSLIYLLPKISMVVRRLRDAGYKPYECLLWYIPAILLNVYLYVNPNIIQQLLDIKNQSETSEIQVYYAIVTIWFITKIISIFMLFSKTKNNFV